MVGCFYGYNIWLCILVKKDRFIYNIGVCLFVMNQKILVGLVVLSSFFTFILIMNTPNIEAKITTGNTTIDSISYIVDGTVNLNAGVYTKVETFATLTVGKTAPTIIYRTWIRWDINYLGIPTDSTFTKAVFKYNGYTKSVGYDAHIHSLEYNPVLSSAQVVYNDCGDGDVYADEAGFIVVGTNKQIELNSLALEEIMYEYSLSPHPYFSLGIQLDTEATTGKYNTMRSEDYLTANPRPTLYLEYQYGTADEISQQINTGNGFKMLMVIISFIVLCYAYLAW